MQNPVRTQTGAITEIIRGIVDRVPYNPTTKVATSQI